MRKLSGQLVFSPSDLICYLKSPFASWMDRWHLEDSNAPSPDEESEDQKLIAQTGDQHEHSVLTALKSSTSGLVEISNADSTTAHANTLSAIAAKAPTIFQAAVRLEPFAGFADFLILNPNGRYQVWDTKLARAPKPYYAIQLCCYSEMLAAIPDQALPEKFGIILGSNDRVEFRVEDFIHYYRRVKAAFLAMQTGFSGDLAYRPEPLPRADHGRWTSHAEKFFTESDHLVQVAGISIGQIKKLKAAGITTVVDLANASGQTVPKLNPVSLQKLVSQASLQRQTRDARLLNPDAPPRFQTLPHAGPNGEPLGLGTLPAHDPADVYFDMEGFPLVAGGLEYLFGACFAGQSTNSLVFIDWWAHDRDEEKLAFQNFVDWVFTRWKASPAMHIYHYAAYEVSALRRLSTRHDTRQNEVDDLLRNEVFVDLYKLVRHGLRIGEDSYSIKKVERLYRPKRSTQVATASDSIVQYARWMESRQPRKWGESAILKAIRDYNEDDCKSTAELVAWLRQTASANGVPPLPSRPFPDPEVPQPPSAAAIAASQTLAQLRTKTDPVSAVLADLIDFHRREQKPMWWRMFDRSVATDEELRDDPGCIQGVQALGQPTMEKNSLVQPYTFDPSQECKLAADDQEKVMFTHNLGLKLGLFSLDLDAGRLSLKATQKSLDKNGDGNFPSHGSLIQYEFISPAGIPDALAEVAAGHLAHNLHPPVAALLSRSAPASLPQLPTETSLSAATRVSAAMSGECLVIQGPPGTGKTFTASRVIKTLLATGKTVGIMSNSHKAVLNLVSACGSALKETGASLYGIKVGGENDDPVFSDYPGFRHIKQTSDARDEFKQGIVAGTAWLFSRLEWQNALDYLFIDEAGQVSLANTVAVGRSAKNLVLLGDQMQLEQPIQGAHPGDSGLSALQYALKDTTTSKPDVPVFHAVVPPALGIFLGESRRMHPEVCRFISESIYEGRLRSHPDCAQQCIALPTDGGTLVAKSSGIVFSGVQHDGNIQQSEEEVERVEAIYYDLFARPYTASDGTTRPLTLNDFLFIAPYNAQVRALQAALPPGARVASVDKFQGQEAPVCILSLCSSYGEYGSRGLGFILDRNRVNVAISRAQCLAVVVADPRIANSPAGSLAQMTLLNRFCKLVGPVAAPVPAPLEPRLPALLHELPAPAERQPAVLHDRPTPSLVGETRAEGEPLLYPSPSYRTPNRPLIAADVITALALPSDSRVDQRVPKKLLIENGAPTAADKRHIQDGLEELVWLAALKPSNIAVPAFKDPVREYLEIAVISATLRTAAKTPRLIELIHRAIPYPVVLVTSQDANVTFSVAHKRWSQNENNKVVVETGVATALLNTGSTAEQGFVATLPLSAQPRQDLFSLYQGWIDRVASLAAARITGAFALKEGQAASVRQTALVDHTLMKQQIAALRAQAAKEKQMNRRVELNLSIKQLEARIAELASKL